MSQKITIITVVYNGVNLIEKTILSVLNQKYKHIEYIIIDGSSTDGTIDIIKKYNDKISYWISEKDNGIYDAMNKGIEIATGNGLIFLNAGDYFVGNVLTENMPVPSYLSVKTVENDNLVNIKLKSEKLGISNCHQGIVFENKKIKYNLEYRIAADYDYFLRHGYTTNNVTLLKSSGYVFYDNNGYSKVNYKLRDKEIATIILKKFGYLFFIRFKIISLIKQLIKGVLRSKKHDF